MGGGALRSGTNWGRGDKQMGWTSFGERSGAPGAQRLRDGSAAIDAAAELSLMGKANRGVHDSGGLEKRAQTV